MRNLSVMIVVICLLILCEQKSLAVNKDVRLLTSDRNGCTIEYKPHYLSPKKISSDNQEFVRYDFEGSIPNLGQSSGTPEVSMQSILLHFPGANDNSVEVLNIDYEDIPNILIVPVPRRHPGEIDIVNDYVIDPDAYKKSEFMPATLASIENIGETRGRFLGQLQIFPLQYNAGQRLLRKYNRIVVRVNYGNPESPHKVMQQNSSMAINDDAFLGVRAVSSAMNGSAVHNSVLSSGSWFRMTIKEDGMYKLSGQVLLNAGIPAGTDPHTIKIYNNGGIEGSMSVTQPMFDDLLENAIYVFDNGNNKLDASDYIIFYGKSTRGWKYNSATKSFSHYINHYDDNNYYWITFGDGQSKTMTDVPSQNQTTAARYFAVNAKIFREDDRSNAFSSGIEWLGESFISGGQIVYRFQLPGLDLTQPINYKFNLGAVSATPSYFYTYEHDSLLTSQYVYGYSYEYLNYYNSVVPAQRVPNFSGEESQIRFRYDNPGSGGRGYIDWCEIYYQRFLKAQNDIFNFHTLDTTGIVEYKISGFSGGAVMVFDVSKFDSVLLITNPITNVDTCTFQIGLTSGSIHELYTVGQNGFKIPGTLTSVSNQNLHGDTSQAKYIIITHSDFMSAAERLKDYRSRLSKNPISTRIVDVNKIYNEFSCGMVSPIAIRNYLKYIYLNQSVSPEYVLLFGDGDFDYKRIMGSSNPNWVPPWESAESFANLSSYASDDYYGIFFPGERVNLGIGRLPVRSLKEANQVVDKIIEYETKSVTDSWKMRFTFVADDGPQAAGRNDGAMHMNHTEGIAAMVPALFEKKKIYLYEYPTIYTSAGRRKPAVNEAIQNAINQGTLVLTFAGHGNPRLWTHEAVFVRETDFPMLHNKGKYFFLVAATCNYGVFDGISDQSSGEILTLMPDAGAIGVFSAVRPVYPDANYALNVDLNENLLDTVQFGRIRPQRLGDIIYKTKQKIHDLVNDRKYYLLGDPGLQLSFPELIAAIDSVDHSSNDHVVQLKSLAHASIIASVRDTVNYQPTEFRGKAQLVVYDADKINTINEPEFGQPFIYSSSGSVIFRGLDSVNQGKIAGDFVVPKDISYSSGLGRVVVYFSNESADGAGYTTNIQITGTDTTALVDNKGPTIHLYLDRKSFRPGDVVNSSPVLYADLSDSSGINTSGAGIGHRLEAWLDDKSESIDLSDYYQSKINTYKEGTIEYKFGELTNGTHKLRLRAWDTYNNPSTEETMFNVVTGEGLRVFNVYNYPNPFSTSTVFTFEHNQVTPLDVEVKIFTVAGRFIQSLRLSNIAGQFVKIPWDGSDRDGDRLGNGVYLYKVIAKTQDGRFTSEAFGKLSVLK